MFRKEKNEQNENILYLSSILNYHIMFTIFRFQKITTLDTGKRNFRFISLPSNYDDCGFTGMKTFVEMVSHSRKKAITMYFR